MSTGVQAIGFTEAISHMRGIADRMMMPIAALAPELLVLEAEERAIFEALHGRFVDTGRAERSLTSAGGEAIRAIHGELLEFGTNVEYVRYLTAERDGKHHHGRNAVLISGFEAREGGASKRILRRIVGE